MRDGYRWRFGASEGLSGVWLTLTSRPSSGLRKLSATLRSVSPLLLQSLGSINMWFDLLSSSFCVYYDRGDDGGRDRKTQDRPALYTGEWHSLGMAREFRTRIPRAGAHRSCRRIPAHCECHWCFAIASLSLMSFGSVSGVRLRALKVDVECELGRPLSSSDNPCTAKVWFNRVLRKQNMQ